MPKVPPKTKNWLDRLLPPPEAGRAGLPSLDLGGAWPALSQPHRKGKPGALPNAALIYGIAAAILFAYALYSLATGSFMRGLLVLFPALTLFGFSLFFIRYPS